MNLSLVTGCTPLPVPDSDPIYRFDRYWTTRLQDNRWTIRFDNDDLANHFMEQAESVGFTDVQKYGSITNTIWFTSPTSSTTGTLILSSQIALAVLAAAGEYWESLENHFQHSEMDGYS